MTSAMPTPKRPVLAGIDRGPGHDDLVRFAAREAALRRRPLRIVHALELPLPGGSISDQDESRSASKAGVQLMAHYEQLALEEAPELSVGAELIMGHAAAGLIERSADAELIVMGHRGSGGFPRLPLGSVSWQVATHADCPVVVVRPAETAERPQNRVVVGVDTDDASLQALDLAYLEADVRGAHLDVVHCAFNIATSPTGAIATVPVDPTAAQSGEQEFLDNELRRRRDRHPDVTVTLRIDHSSPGPLLVEISAGASLLVVGSNRRTGVRRFLLGSVSAEVLHTAHCPVAVVPLQRGD
ncbi:universal stress protein [Streptomyces sp. NPDC007984]|uniref:universal stress protein n=1 Tax=Streptomyces sp. NPDC007984 TaxID=3364801 RepID=UPI0036E54D15